MHMLTGLHKEVMGALEILRDGLVKHGLEPNRCAKAIEKIGKPIGGGMPALASARVSAYKNLGIPTPELEKGLIPAPTAEGFKMDKNGWRALLNNAPIPAKSHTIESVSSAISKGNAQAFVFKDYCWTMGDNKIAVRRINDPMTPIKGIPDGELGDTIDAARKVGVPIPPFVETVALNVYGLAPLLAPFTAHVGIGSLAVQAVDENGNRVNKSVPEVLNELAGLDILGELRAGKIPDKSVPIPKSALWKNAKLTEPRGEWDNFFSHTDNEVASAMLTLHPEYEVRVLDNQIWLADPQNGIGMSAKDLSNRWNKCELKLNINGRITLAGTIDRENGRQLADTDIEFDSGERYDLPDR